METNESLNNHQDQNSGPDIQMPASESNDSKPTKNKLKIPFIIFLVLTVFSLTFGIFEFIQNSSLKTEIADLKAKIEAPEKPEEPKDTIHNIYSGALEYTYSTFGNEDGEPIPEDTPKQEYTVRLNFDASELYVKHESIGNCPDMNCGESTNTITLTDKEMKKIWWITRGEYDQGDLTEALEMIALSDESETTEDDEATNCADRKEINCLSIDYRATGNSRLDDLLYNIYGEIECMAGTCIDLAGFNCTPEYDDETFNCKTAKEVDYPYIVEYAQ